MSRPIKFRAWDAIRKEWLSRTYYITEDGMLEIYRPEKAKPMMTRTKYEIGKQYIVEQFTGLTDKNGKGIYEGDIVDWTGKKQEESEWPRVVEFNGDQFTYKYPRHAYGSGVASVNRGMEVIGNIHENPELVK